MANTEAGRGVPVKELGQSGFTAVILCKQRNEPGFQWFAAVPAPCSHFSLWGLQLSWGGAASDCGFVTLLSVTQVQEVKPQVKSLYRTIPIYTGLYINYISVKLEGEKKMKKNPNHASTVITSA